VQNTIFGGLEAGICRRGRKIIILMVFGGSSSRRNRRIFGRNTIEATNRQLNRRCNRRWCRRNILKIRIVPVEIISHSSIVAALLTGKEEEFSSGKVARYYSPLSRIL
jgi:hypothetical protein